MRSNLMRLISLHLVLLLLVSVCEGKVLRYAFPEKVKMDSKRLSKIDSVIQKEIDKGKLPGAAVLIARKGYVVYRKSFGYAQITPEKEVMKVDYIFDLASLTKPIATATSIMILVENGKIRLFDPVNMYIPEFTSFKDDEGKEFGPIRIYHLLTHTSGLPPYTDAAKLKEMYGEPCPDELIYHIATIEKSAPPGKKFEYSCLGFITLGEIIRIVSGMTIDEFTKREIFEPLKMKSTMFCPPDELKGRIAPTEVFDGIPLRGRVHDPLAQLMGGKSGNAGLFSNVDDLAIFAQMMLNGGSYGNVRILSPLTVKSMTRVYPSLEFAGRGLGWDINTEYSSNRGDIFPVGSFGHTGFTGTSIWIDPTSETFVILLTNCIHLPEGNVIRLRSLIANIVAGSIMGN